MRVSLDAARRALLSAVHLLPVEAVPLPEAAGRILQEAILARVTLPAADRAALDGYAVRAGDLSKSGGTRLRLAATVTAGLADPPVLPPGHCVAVMTGAALPPGTDAVVPWEATRRDADVVRVTIAPDLGSGIRRAGDEARRGEALVPPGTPADPRTLERLAAQGITSVSVPRRARVRLFATGDELVPPGEEPRAGQRVASNLPMLEAQVRACGGWVDASMVVPDDLELLRRALANSLKCDLVLTTGGTLRGTKDHTKAALADLGATFLFDGVAMRPGSSCAAAVGQGSTILCLPGSPGAAFLAFVALGRPLLRALHGWGPPVPALMARLVAPVASSHEEAVLVSGVVQEVGGRLEFQRNGAGWPALGILATSAGSQGRAREITVELLPLAGG